MKDQPIEDMKKRAPSAEEIAAENLRRYVELAIEIDEIATAAPDLTHLETRRSVSEGLVDPSTFKTTG